MKPTTILLAILAATVAGTPTLSDLETREAEAESVGLLPRVRTPRTLSIPPNYSPSISPSCYPSIPSSNSPPPNKTF
ncbi:hypothetical protein IQ07DRAFT_588380 [Pyrenochaeta sp. DS3sAY3a]|nr:hypothetical protein IQ07DRAFT_588380 [Pyrenochaeta sp. DS3sAY3a]